MRNTIILLFALGCLLMASSLNADPVKVTALGARTGEFCSPDRALLFEDPTGVKILYDPATTVAGGTDMRLQTESGGVDVVLVSHAHSDHLGNAKLSQDPNASNAGCGQAATVPTPGTNTAEIVATQKAAFVGSGELATFIASKIQQTFGITVSGCPTSGLTNETIVPNLLPCTASLGYGAKRTIRKASAAVGVRIALVPAVHGNALSNTFLIDPLASQLQTNGVSIAPGTASGYTIQFTNGLNVYLSGDTGLSSDMLLIIRRFYHPDLVIFNIGDIFTTGPEEAAFAINELIEPTTVIPSHANEIATSSGAVMPGTKTARFMQLVNRADVVPPLSGQVMQFDGSGHCISGCATSKHHRH